MLIISHSTQGFSLIEVVIGIALLSLVLIGLDAMELSALRHCRETYLFSVAADQLQVMEERLLLLPEQDIAPEMALWNHDNNTVLPNGRGELNQSLLTILWGNAEQQNCDQKQKGLSGCLQKRVTTMASHS